ncbi:threonine ammonia-lyase IlvA [Massilibacteroides sp.]|uniref:threonine ammonia-lyase IlvA n=1 Tax=Massilibacteroides sp. TaxID=2034766 RepID=UPI0026292899|nr:threonine ammonia-lyase IlvA [Massilibacteroides sp.]MDD4516041.1 threonine ammonia-lyase IlvA [Massilibacteroides sp.]
MSILTDFDLHIEQARECIRGAVQKTPLQYNKRISTRYGATVYLKREDLQIVRSYKLRGAYNMIKSLDKDLLKKGVVCASAGNHAQGFAFSCNEMQIKGVIFMPKTTPKQKIKQTKMFGKEFVEVILEGDTFDDCADAAKKYTAEQDMTFVPPFDHPRIIEGQGTIAVEILEELKGVDYLFIPVGGGGLCAGVGAYMKEHSPNTKIIAVEPQGAASMKAAFEAGGPVTLNKIDKFVDGAAVKRAGDITYPICKQVVDDICLIPEGEVCSAILRIYNKDAIVIEPAGALAAAAIKHYREEIKGKTVVSIISGSNNDIDRMQEIKERSLLFEGLKHYFIIRFTQRPSALKDFVNKVLGPHDDIVRFEYMKKNEKESGPALVGIELNSPEDYDPLISRMYEYEYDFTVLNKDSDLFGYLV